MWTKRIPTNYDYDDKELVAAIHVVLGKVPVSINSRGFITLDQTPSAAEKAALKAIIVPLLTDIGDVTA